MHDFKTKMSYIPSSLPECLTTQEIKLHTHVQMTTHMHKTLEYMSRFDNNVLVLFFQSA